MPKVSLAALPVSALFGIVKPSGPTSMAVLNDVKKLVSSSSLFMPTDVAVKNSTSGLRKDKGRKGRRERRGLDAKIGQGGTLDPLAEGVLVVGVGKGTKKLGEFLDCVKEYRTTCLLGCETDSYDSEGAQVRSAPWKHVTREKVEAALEKFRGEIEQTPPIFSALKMDGKPLYEYARSGIPLPRPIESRKVTVHSLELLEWLPSGSHAFRLPEKKFTDEERAKLARSLRGAQTGADKEIKVEVGERIKIQADEGIRTEAGVEIKNKLEDEIKIVAEEETQIKAEEGSATGVPEESNTEEESASDGPPAFVLQMRVSGGTYVRCISHDIGHALGSAAHIVTLTRLTQGRFTMADESEQLLEEMGTNKKQCIPWEVFTQALQNREASVEEETDADGWRPWERAIADNMEIVE